MSTVIKSASDNSPDSATTGNETRWEPISTSYVRRSTVVEHTEPMTTAPTPLDYDLARRMLTTAIDEAVRGRDEGGIPIGAALFTRSGELLGAGHNRRVQEDDASVHAETDAFRRAGRRRGYRDTVMVTTLSPCWYCSGLVRQFNIGAVVIGESTNFSGGHEWLAELGVEVIVLDDPTCTELLSAFIHDHAQLWNEDIGE